ncbi:hypothetical protein PFISCL1PPCAC_18492, partial [Pristionchus fissidentatus]
DCIEALRERRMKVGLPEEGYKDCLPVSTHSILLKNGVQVVIEMHYDLMRWTLCGIRWVDKLADLRLVFESEDQEETLFLLKTDEFSTLWSTCISRFSRTYLAHFRLGPLLAQLVGGGGDTVVCQVAQAAGNDGSKRIVRVHVEVFEVGARGVIIEGKKYPVNTEIFALHSAYFQVLFYGNFIESRQKWIELHDVTTEGWEVVARTLLRPPSRYAYNSEEDSYSGAMYDVASRFDSCDIVPPEELVKEMLWELQVFDRFDLPQYSAVHKSDYLLILGEARDSNDFGLVELSTVADAFRDDVIVTSYLNRFVKVDTMNEYVEKWKEMMECPRVERSIQLRREELAAIRRPQLECTLVDGGKIVVSLLVDFHPIAVATLIRSCEKQGSLRYPFVEDRYVMLMGEVEKVDKKENRFPFLPLGHYLVVEIDPHLTRQCVTFRDFSRKELPGWRHEEMMVVGVVIEGMEHIGRSRVENIDVRGPHRPFSDCRLQ